MTKPTHDRAIFDGLSTPRPPAALRARALEAARSSPSARPVLSAWSLLPALFKAQPWWSMAAAALLLAHATLGFFQRGTETVRTPLPRDEEIAAQPDLLRLPRIGGGGRELLPDPLGRPGGEGTLS